jgi:N-acetylmuramoyl-L-alanine amidase
MLPNILAKRACFSKTFYEILEKILNTGSTGGQVAENGSYRGLNYFGCLKNWPLLRSWAHLSSGTALRLIKKRSTPLPWFRLRCIAAAGLTAGFWVSVFAASAVKKPESSSATSGMLEATPAKTPRPQTATRPAIVIDPGHGGKDPGKVAGDQFEKTWTLLLSQTLAAELRSRGIPVELTRTDDTALTPAERIELINRERRSALVSIHFNSGQPEASGIEIYHAWPKSPAAMLRLDSEHQAPAGMIIRDDRGRLLAETLQAAACEATGTRNRGVRNDPSLAAVLNHSTCPAVLIECGFLTNSAECLNIQSEAWRQKLAIGLASRLETWLLSAETAGYGISFEPSATTVPVLDVLNTTGETQ